MAQRKIVPEITVIGCTGCGDCVPACDNDAISVIELRPGCLVAHIKAETCTGCKECLSACGFISWPK